MSQTAKLTAFLARNSKHLIFHARLQDNITSCGLQQLECNYTSGDQINEKMFIANLSCLIRMKISGLGLIKLNVHVVSNSAGIIRVWDSTNQSPALDQDNQWEAGSVWEHHGTTAVCDMEEGQCSLTKLAVWGGWAGGNCNSMSIGLRSMGTLCHIRSGISDKLMNWAGSYNTH